MKVLLVVVLCLVTIGCSTSEMGKMKAEYLCKDLGEVYKISSISGVQCNTGKWFSWNEVRGVLIPVEYITQKGATPSE